MKTLKIIIALAVLGVISFFVWQWAVTPKQVGTVKPPSNQFTARIEREIDSLSKAPANQFSKKFYNDIKVRLADFGRQQFLGNNSSENKLWNDLLSKNLYSIYAAKFIEQAMYVFKGTLWKPEDINLIASEVNLLKGSPYLEANSPIAKKFGEISGILAKYNEITSFISFCNNISFNDWDIQSNFPDLSARLIESRTFLNNNLQNPYVNNCERLKSGLRAIPISLFNKHITYLQKKLNYLSGRFKTYKNQAEYNNAIYQPLRMQIDAISNDVYIIDQDTFDNGVNKLDQLLKKDNLDAFNHFNNN